MNKIVKIILATMVMISMSSVTLSADVAKGQKLYLKKLKSACSMNGAKMATQHSQAEWKAIGNDAGLAAELKKICPSVKDKALKGKYLPHYYDFFFEYANDSGNVPSC
ncbi:cytochrome C [Sulfurimonas sp.]|uniref:cytochrome C n=1 Tax=Sulfurimonas sp. TaxID=2022749 RepID=UPI002B459C46|nr:cytochrome C [Sulfurimonas sp.]